MTTVKHLRIHGRVQGVGYRYAMRSRAQIHGVTGWVRNQTDGTVEAMVAGDEQAVAAIIAWAKQGPAGAAVSKVEIEPELLQGLFLVRSRNPARKRGNCDGVEFHGCGVIAGQRGRLGSRVPFG